MPISGNGLKRLRRRSEGDPSPMFFFIPAMNNDHREAPNTTPLAGARIWLSGAVPDVEEGTVADIIEFVKVFSRLVFERGGYLVHGSHPSFTPTLLAESRRHRENGGSRDRLVLAVSRHWSKDPGAVPTDEWRRDAVVYETPEVTGERARDGSLELLRKWMASTCDAIVMVGGRWSESASERAGIPFELNLSIARGIPCFLLGGFGGAAREYATRHPDILDRLKNGLSESENRRFATEKDARRVAEMVCRHLERLPLVRGQGSSGVSFRILALDGGGLKGTFTAAALATWEEQTGLRIVEHFDLIAGTSTGGILALGLGAGLSAREMLDFYRNRGPTIFPVTGLRQRIHHLLRHILKPKYSQQILLTELQAALNRGNTRLALKDSQCRLVIPTYHAVSGESQVLRTPHHPNLTADANTLAADAALATAAAPTYFAAAKIANMVAESSYFDGGVWANSPAMAAVIEAVCFLGIPLERIDVLSVGTTDEPFTVRKLTKAGLLQWIWKAKLLRLLMNAQQESSLKLAMRLVGDPHFLRVDSLTAPGSYKLDGPKEISELADLGNHIAVQPETLCQVKSRFLNGVRAPRWQSFA